MIAEGITMMNGGKVNEVLGPPSSNRHEQRNLTSTPSYSVNSARDDFLKWSKQAEFNMRQDDVNKEIVIAHAQLLTKVIALENKLEEQEHIIRVLQEYIINGWDI